MGGQGRCEQRSEVEHSKRNIYIFFFGGGVRLGEGGSQGGCKQRNEVLVKMKKKIGRGGGGSGGGLGREGGWGGQGRCNREVTFL